MNSILIVIALFPSAVPGMGSTNLAPLGFVQDSFTAKNKQLKYGAV